MAGADKISLNKEQYIQIKKRWIETREQQKCELGDEIYMYPFSAFHYAKENGMPELDPSESDNDIDYFDDDPDNYLPVFNVSTRTEIWMYKNFNFEFLREIIRERHSISMYIDIPEELRFDFSVYEDADFTTRDAILSIVNENKNLELYFYKGDKVDENTPIADIELYDEFLVYGSTDFFRYYNEASEIIEGRDYCDDPESYSILYRFCGLAFTHEDDKTFYDGKEVHIPFIRLLMDEIKFKHSYDTIDAKDYHRDQIIISSDLKYGNICYNICHLSSYMSDPTLDRVLFTDLPEYLNRLIKRSS